MQQAPTTTLDDAKERVGLIDIVDEEIDDGVGVEIREGDPKGECHNPHLDHDHRINYDFLSLASLIIPHTKTQIIYQPKGIIEKSSKIFPKNRINQILSNL